MHGGAIAAHLQDCGRRFVERASERPMILLTAHFSFLRFGRPVDVTAQPEPVRIGRSTATIRVSAHQGKDAGRPIACATLTFVAA